MEWEASVGWCRSPAIDLLITNQKLGCAFREEPKTQAASHHNHKKEKAAPHCSELLSSLVMRLNSQTIVRIRSFVVSSERFPSMPFLPAKCY